MTKEEPVEGFIEKLQALAGSVGQNRIIQTISQGLMALMPALMIGSIGSLLQQIPFEGYQAFLASTGLMGVLKAMVNVTTNMLAVYAAFSMAFTFAKAEKKDGFTAGLIALVSFLLVTPMETVGEGYMAVTNLPLTWCGSTGLFTGMIVALVSAKLYCWFIDRNITIKLPDSVPPFVSKSFVGIIPGTAISALWAIVNLLMGLTPFGTLHAVIYGLIAAPLTNLGSSVWAAIIAQLLTGLCWFFGVHGMAVAMVTAPIWGAADAANVSAISAGLPATNIITSSWVQTVCNIGGAGCTLGLMIACLVFAKSQRYRSMGKLAIVPSLFGINEPVVYGFPMMLNPVMAIPFILLPPVLIAISYFLVTVGILPVGNGVGAPTNIPILQGMINMGWRGAVWNVVEIAISLVVYLPFLKALDKQECAVEQANETQADEALKSEAQADKAPANDALANEVRASEASVA